MNTLEEEIFRYTELSDAEQRAVEERVSGRSKYRALLDEVKRLEAELRRVQLPDVTDSESDLPDAVLALYALHTVSDTRSSHSERLQQLFADIEARLEDDPVLRERVEPMIDRAHTLDDTFDLAKHMQSVTGVDMESLPPREASADAIAQNDVAQASEPSHASGSSLYGSAPSTPRDDRSPAEPGDGDKQHRISEQVWHAVQYAAMAVVALLLVYGGLLGVSLATQSSAEQLAVLDPDETEIEGYQVRTRSAVRNELSGNDERFLHALQLLQDAYSAPLGLFPQFDQDYVEEAQDLLEQVVENEDSGSFLQLEASFFLAKTHLAQHDIEPARRSLKRVVMGEGRRINEAAQMLKTLQEEYPMEEPTLPEDAQL